MTAISPMLKAQSVADLFGVPKPPVKQKQITYGNALVLQMCSSRADLAEGRPPTGKTRPRPAYQIRVQVRALVSDPRPGGKFFYDLAKTLAIRRSDFIISQAIQR